MWVSTRGAGGHRMADEGWQVLKSVEKLRTGRLSGVMRLYTQMIDDNLLIIAAGVAFFGLLSLFPAITAVLAVGGLVIDADTIVDQTALMEGVVPDDVIEIIRNQATSVVTSEGLGMTLLISLLLALWSASRGVNAMCNGLNVVYGESERRNVFVKNGLVLVLTCVIIFGLIVMFALMGILPVLLAYFPLGPVAGLVTQWGSWAMIIGMSLFCLGLLYRFGPSRKNPRWRWVSPGAVVACLGWIAASHLFTVYATSFGTYNQSFGALAGVIVLMLWLWITILVVLLGGLVNAELEAKQKCEPIS